MRLTLKTDETMTDKKTQQMSDQSNTEKRPEDWTTGDEAMTGAQRSYLKTLSEEAKVDFDENLTKAQASVRIDELQQTTGRGQPRKSEEQRTSESGQAEGDAHGGNFRGVSDFAER